MIAIDPDMIDFRNDDPHFAFLPAPASFAAHSTRRAIQRGEELRLDFAGKPQAGDLILLDREMALANYSIDIECRNVVAVVAISPPTAPAARALRLGPQCSLDRKIKRPASQRRPKNLSR